EEDALAADDVALAGSGINELDRLGALFSWFEEDPGRARVRSNRTEPRIDSSLQRRLNAGDARVVDAPLWAALAVDAPGDDHAAVVVLSLDLAAEVLFAGRELLLSSEVPVGDLREVLTASKHAQEPLEL